MKEYESFKIRIENQVAHVAINRPEKANALHKQAWADFKALFEEIDETPEIRVVILSGEGKHFCAGIDLEMLMDVQAFQSGKCEARKRERLMKHIQYLQSCFTAIEKCRKPVLAAIQKACVGGAVDVITACDIRYCTEDAYFSIKEVDMGLVADVGTMQRLPKIINPGIMAELAYTGRKVDGAEAAQIGLVTRTYPDKAEMYAAVTAIAETIAAKSPLVIRGTKQIMQYTRDHGVDESLHYMSVWNSALLMSDDLMEAFQATIQKRKAEFAD